MKPSKIILAPMEGVIDHLMRELLTEFNSYDLCIAEFVRVVDRKVPEHTFYKIVPELHNAGQTKSGCPVRVQLLGQDPDWMAENALIAHQLGSPGIDLNFGCPAKTVNKSRGGASLLKDPELMFQVISRVKGALKNTGQPLSAKIRLGFDDTSLLDEIIDAVRLANPDMLTVHARTKRQGYKPPAYWEFIKEIRGKLSIPVVANGEIWTADDIETCMIRANTDLIMLGRGALATPNLANVALGNEKAMTWHQVCELIKRWILMDIGSQKPFYYSSRLKQWYRYLKLQFTEADALFSEIKTLQEKDEVLSVIEEHLAKAL